MSGEIVDEIDLSGVVNLEHVMLSFIAFDLRSTVKSPFECLTKLRQLIFHRCILANTSPNLNLFENLEKLELLMLNGTEIPIIPTFPTNLKYLCVSLLRIQKLNPELFKNCIQLQFLDASNNSIDQIEDVTFENLKDLTYLNLSSNAISAIGTWLNCLVNLSALDLSQNKITTSCLAGIFNLINLEKLNISGNLIDRLGEGAFLTLTNLKFLDLSQNNLDISQESIFLGLDKLEELRLNGIVQKNTNSLLINKSFFNGLENLKKLLLRHNKLVSIGDDLFTNVPNLSYLDLSHNQLKLDESTFSSLKNLRSLILNSNSLEKLPNSFLNNQSKLKLLSLGKNRLSLFEASAIVNLTNLRELDLNKNLINDFDLMSILVVLKNIKKIILQNNPILDNQNVIEQLKSAKITYNTLFLP